MGRMCPLILYHSRTKTRIFVFPPHYRPNFPLDPASIPPMQIGTFHHRSGKRENAPLCRNQSDIDAAGARADNPAPYCWSVSGWDCDWIRRPSSVTAQTPADILQGRDQLGTRLKRASSTVPHTGLRTGAIWIRRYAVRESASRLASNP